MKRLFCLLSALLIASIFCSCAQTSGSVITPSNDTSDTLETNTATENGSLSESAIDPSTDPSEISTESSTEQTIVINENNVSGASLVRNNSGGEYEDMKFCDIHHSSYHVIPGPLVTWVESHPREDGTTFSSWEEYEKQTDPSSDCPYANSNIKAFIDYFNIPKEVFEDKIYRYSDVSQYVYDADLLYSDDYEAIENWFKDFDRLNIVSIKQQRYFSMINELANSQCDGNWLNTDYAPETFSIFTIVRDFKIERSYLEAFVAEFERISRDKSLNSTYTALDERFQKGEITSEEKDKTYDYYKNEYDPKTHYTYNFDVLYNDDGTIKEYEEANDRYQIYGILSEFCGVDNFILD